jgi:hypothetical protein
MWLYRARRSSLRRTPTLLMEYTGGALVWRFTMIDPGIGIIGPLARCASQGVAYWMGRDNFYMWSGGNVEVIPSNSGDISTGFKYVFENINTAQKSKCFVWFNEKFSEVWFHYPSANSNECDRVARVNTHDFTWSFDEMDRTAAEWPYAVFGQPRLVSSDNVAYRHEGSKTCPLRYATPSRALPRRARASWAVERATPCSGLWARRRTSPAPLACSGKGLPRPRRRMYRGMWGSL